MKQLREGKYSARRGNSPRRNFKSKPNLKWTIEKSGDEWFAEAGRIRVYADSLEKLKEWVLA